jgi:hypothetical protein
MGRPGAPRDREEAPPPILGSWRNLYTFVLIELGALIALFLALTRWAS